MQMYIEVTDPAEIGQHLAQLRAKTNSETFRRSRDRRTENRPNWPLIRGYHGRLAQENGAPAANGGTRCDS